MLFLTMPTIGIFELSGLKSESENETGLADLGEKEFR